MRFRLVLSSLSFSLLIVLPMSLRGQREIPVSNLTVRQQIDTEVLNLGRNLKLITGLDDKFVKLDKELFVIRLIRKKNPRQLTDDEIYLDNLVASLSEIPKYADFKIDSCPKYRKKLIHQWDPKAGAASEDPSLKKTLDVLAALCVP